MSYPVFFLFKSSFFEVYYKIVRYVPMIIITIDRNFREMVCLSISSFKNSGFNLVRMIAYRRTKNG